MPLFLDVYDVAGSDEFLFYLLAERENYMNISHKGMPTFDEHYTFVQSKPYEDWRIIEDGGILRGSVYLTRNREVGIHILKAYCGMGYGKEAIDFMEKKHGLPIYANISVNNPGSMAFFDKRGYRRLQETWIKDGGDSGSGDGPCG